MAKLKILGLVPARGGSKGIPGKNIKLLGGKPLLQYTVEMAGKSRKLSKLILSSEDEKIIALAKKMGLEVPFVRPENLALDASTSLEVVRYALNFFSEKGENFDAVCLLQPTTPFRQPNLIDDAITKFQKGDYDSLISVRQVPSEFNPHWIFEEKDGELNLITGEKDVIPRRQELPRTYYRDGAIYITKTEVVLEQNSLFGSRIGFLDTTGSPYVNLDTPEDWKKAEEIVKKIDPETDHNK
ncbi:MAG TPA: acylneuraminate cytidylyltransferase family protein [Salinimicrobium sp.]|nr:acylneuraminate cytidylyltransferase family protein [Salinimicrobium sp.]